MSEEQPPWGSNQGRDGDDPMPVELDDMASLCITAWVIIIGIIGAIIMVFS